MKFKSCCEFEHVDGLINDFKKYLKEQGVSEEITNSFVNERDKLLTVINDFYLNDTEGAEAFKTNIEEIITKLGIDLNDDEAVNKFINQIRVSFELPYFTCLSVTNFDSPSVGKKLVFGRCYKEAEKNLILLLE